LFDRHKRLCASFVFETARRQALTASAIPATGRQALSSRRRSAWSLRLAILPIGAYAALVSCWKKRGGDQHMNPSYSVKRWPWKKKKK